MFLSKESLNVQLVTAKSSEMNIVVPEGKKIEKKISAPRSYRRTYKNKLIVRTDEGRKDGELYTIHDIIC